MAKGNQYATDKDAKVPEIGFSYVQLSDGKPPQMKFNGFPNDPIRAMLIMDQIAFNAKQAFVGEWSKKIIKKVPQQEESAEPPVGEKVNENVTDTEECKQGSN